MNPYNKIVKQHFDYSRAYNDLHKNGGRRLAYLYPVSHHEGAVKAIQRKLEKQGLPGKVELIESGGWAKHTYGVGNLKLVIYIP